MLGRGLQKDGCVMAEDTHHYHYDENWDENPVSKGRVQEKRLHRPSHGERRRVDCYVEGDCTDFADRQPPLIEITCYLLRI